MFHSEPIFQPNPAYPSCHAATVVEVSGGRLLAAWFAGTHEGHPDVSIWLAHYDGNKWSKPVELIHEPATPLWNPVLFRDASDTVWLFYKAGPNVPAWTGLYVKSIDGGQTWSTPTALPAGLLGPAKNKPVVLSNGDIICGTSAETWRSWACWVEISADGGLTWSKYGPIVAPGFSGNPSQADEPVSAVWDSAAHRLALPQEHYGLIQPTLWEYSPGRLKMLMRATQRVGAVCTASSEDYGHTWSPAVATDVPHSNSGLDAARLSDGRVVLVCNPVTEGRTPLSLLISEDNGESWPQRIDVETKPGEYSYPSIVQAQDGAIHVVYTYQRRTIRHLAVTPDELAARASGW